jgi:hypothetical protein
LPCSRPECSRASLLSQAGRTRGAGRHRASQVRQHRPAAAPSFLMLWPGVPVHAVGVLSPADLAGLIDRVSVPRRNPLFDQMANRDWSSLLHRARIARSIGSPTWTHLFCRGWNNDNHHNHRAQDQSFHDAPPVLPWLWLTRHAPYAGPVRPRIGADDAAPPAHHAPPPEVVPLFLAK